MTTHLLLLVAEMALTVSIVLSLFALRRRIGLAPLYLVLGAFQYLQMVLAAAIRIELVPGVLIQPAAMVLFPITTFVVLLTYIEQDAEETRKLAYGIVIANLAVYGVTTLASGHLAVSHPSLTVLPFEQHFQQALASTMTLFVDIVAALLIFERVSRWVSAPLFIRRWLTAVCVMAIDTVLFMFGAFYGRPNLGQLLAMSFVSKVVGATFYAACIAAYLRFVDGHAMAVGDRAPRDVFHWLTYRQRYEAVRSQMARDALTGVFNRGYFDEFAPQQLAHAARAGHQMSLVLIDVDRLKSTNDRHGHQAGDDLLKFVAEGVGSVVRASDAVCRYGGDEFVVVLTTADAEAARIFAERLLELVSVRSQALRPTPMWSPASVSIGVATFPADGRTVAELLQNADERLYRGKRRGGDAVVSA